MTDSPAPEPITSSPSGDLNDCFLKTPENIEIETNNLDISTQENSVTYKSRCNCMKLPFIFLFLVVGSALIFFGITKLDFDGFIFIIFGGLFVGAIIFGSFFENIFVTITIDGNNKLLLIKRTRICYCLKESYNLDDIVNITFQLNNSENCTNKNYDSFDIIFNLPRGKSINEINKVDKDGEKQRVYNTLRRIIPQYIPIIGGPE